MYNAIRADKVGELSTYNFNGYERGDSDKEVLQKAAKILKAHPEVMNDFEKEVKK